MKTNPMGISMPHLDLDAEQPDSGVTVYGINETADAFEPLFKVAARTEAERIIRKLCQACESISCPDWKRNMTACYTIIDHCK
ncbi:hypothetical protein RYZ26_02415 [Terasakiella sp. A23]|uniref:hypothetical protein n=1 Tax=Terasakiella sp. FCG-A23 TaxID=3080561 RepID=UPI002954148A|nr:hypothetical protein [Terasakiella sp. A23]MDV7338434.1 hypothetical protein [Terasakiella sp. A23]